MTKINWQWLPCVQDHTRHSYGESISHEKAAPDSWENWELPYTIVTLPSFIQIINKQLKRNNVNIHRSLTDKITKLELHQTRPAT